MIHQLEEAVLTLKSNIFTTVGSEYFWVTLAYDLSQELLNFHLDSRANWKISKRHFFGDFLNSFNWVTQIGPKTTQKIFFENISKTTGATVVQNFGILDGAADLWVEIWPKFFCQFRAVMWWTFAENFNEISQTVLE